MTYMAIKTFREETFYKVALFRVCVCVSVYVCLTFFLSAAPSPPRPPPMGRKFR